MAGLSRDSRALLFACVCAAACGDDEGPPTKFVPGDMDASESQDASSDAGADGSQLDDGSTSVPADGGARMDGGKPPVCTIKAAATVTATTLGVAPNEPIALAVRNEAASLAWVGFESGKPRVSQLWYAPNGHLTGVPFPHLDQGQPSIASFGSSFLTVWSESESAGTRLRAQVFTVSENLVVDPAPVPVYVSESTDVQNSVVARGADGNALVVWQNRTAPLHGTAQLLGAGAVPVGQPHDVPAFQAIVGQPALQPLGAGYVLAWVDSAGARVHLQALDATGAPTGPARIADTEGNATGALDLATSDQGGALVFELLIASSRSEVRFRTFDLTGTPTRAELPLVDGVESGRMPTISALRGGYIAAYRSLQAPQTQLRVRLLDDIGKSVATADITPLTYANMPVSLRASADGANLSVAWVDGSPDTATYGLNHTWIRCD